MGNQIKEDLSGFTYAIYFIWLQFVILAALIACASAGGPASYSIASPSHDYHSVGSSQEHTVKVSDQSNFIL